MSIIGNFLEPRLGAAAVVGNLLDARMDAGDVDHGGDRDSNLQSDSCFAGIAARSATIFYDVFFWLFAPDRLSRKCFRCSLDNGLSMTEAKPTVFASLPMSLNEGPFGLAYVYP